VAKLSQTGTLPAGVTFVDNGNGTATLSGTPLAVGGTPPLAVAGSYTLTITATANGFPPVTQTFKLTVDQPPLITSTNSTTFTVGQKGSFSITTAGYPVATLSESGTLPKGITFTAGTGGTASLSGTPTAAGTYTFTLTASNGVLPGSVQLFTLTVVAPKSGPMAGLDLSDAATQDAALMAVLADSDGSTADAGTKKGLSLSDLWLFDGA
jgi:hypothetical protein